MAWPALAFLAFLIAQRLGELAIAERNTTRLLAEGAHEVAPGHYPAMVAMHSAWIGCMIGFGYANPVSIPWLLAFAALQALRVWILVTLGPRWTTRIIVLPQPLVSKGPFRYLRHPNYTLVVAEIIVAPMVLGLWWVAAIFTILNAIILTIRIRAEDAALAPLRSKADDAPP